MSADLSPPAENVIINSYGTVRANVLSAPRCPYPAYAAGLPPVLAAICRPSPPSCRRSNRCSSCRISRSIFGKRGSLSPRG